jgi:hypothetical protein
MDKTDRVFVWCEAPVEKTMRRMTKGEDYVVTGGTEMAHEMLVDFTQTFAKRVHKNFPQNEAELDATTKDVMEKVFGKEARKRQK